MCKQTDTQQYFAKYKIFPGDQSWTYLSKQHQAKQFKHFQYSVFTLFNNTKQNN